MLDLALSFAISCFALALLLAFWRFLRGPQMADRLLAMDTMVVDVIALLVLYGIRAGTGLGFEVAILLAMTGFVSTLVFCKYLLRGRIIE